MEKLIQILISLINIMNEIQFSISGNVIVGHQITINNDLNINSNISYIWQYSTQNISWNNITGENSKNYLIKSTDSGYFLRCIIKYLDKQYIVNINDIVPYQSIFYLKGKLLVGNSILVTNRENTDISNYINLEYEWQYSKNNINWINKYYTQPSYLISDIDIGAYLRCIVKYQDAQLNNYTETLYSIGQVPYLFDIEYEIVDQIQTKLENNTSFIDTSLLINDLTFDVDLQINDNIDNTTTTTSYTTETNTIYTTSVNQEDNISTLQESSEDIKYNQLINMAKNKWVNISLLNMDYPNENLITYLKSFNITNAYILDNNTYQNIFDNTYYQQYLERINKQYNSIERHKYIDHKENVPDSCWVKKTSPLITCLIIGINYIGQEDSLTGAINDADNMESFLNNYYGEQINIIKMTDNSSEADCIPNTENIKQKLTGLLSETGKNIIVYYAGHIFKKYNISTSEPDLSDENIKTLDGYISDDWFYSNFVKKINKTVKCRIYFDSCYSCGFMDFKYKYTTKTTIEENSNIDNYQKELNQAKQELLNVTNELYSLKTELSNTNISITETNKIPDGNYKTSKLTLLNNKLTQITTSIENKESEKTTKQTQYQDIINKINNSEEIGETISLSSSGESEKAYEENNQGIFTRELLSNLNQLGNFNITNCFDILTKTNLSSTFVFDKQPILLL